MPQVKPPPGFLTAKQAQERLLVSDTALRRYVKSGELEKYGPVGKIYKPFYKESEVEALRHARQILETASVRNWKMNPSSTFGPAREEDLPAIIDIDTRTFGQPAASLEVCQSWLKKNPSSFYVLKNAEGTVRAYASLFPLDHLVIERFIRNELDGEEITADMVKVYQRGEPIHIYVMATATDPDCTHREKRTYGGRMLSGLLNFLFELAEEGIDVRSITARSFSGKGGLYLWDGSKLMRKMGFTQLKSSVPGISLFVMNIPESGVPIFEEYSERLRKKLK